MKPLASILVAASWVFWPVVVFLAVAPVLR